MTFLKILLPVLIFCFAVGLKAETCPSTTEIIERQISKLFEWTVEEQTTLEDLLSVNQLYAVRIIDEGDFVSCYYTTRKSPLKLDAKPEINSCLVVKKEGQWKSTGSGQLVCQEKNLYDCSFVVDCNRETEN